MTFGRVFQSKTGTNTGSGLYCVSMQKKFNILILLAVVFAFETSYAVKEVIFRQQTQIYLKRNTNSEVLGVYDRGDTIPISKKVYGRWRKVIVDVDGKKKVGWVPTKDIRGARIIDSKIREIKKEEKDGIPNYRSRNGFGIIGNLSYVYQSKGDLSFVTGGSAIPIDLSYSSLSGANVFVSLFGDFNLSDTMALRGYFAIRNMKRSGSATTQGGNGNFTLTHNLMAIGTTLKFYGSKKAALWWGPGLELAKTTEISLKGSTNLGSNIYGEISKEPFFILTTISAGYDMNLSGRFFILPEVKFGLVPNGDPLAFTFEILIPIAFTF